MDTKFKEIEYKYSAEHITMDDFFKFCRDRNPHKHVIGFGPDHFYHSLTDKNSFHRFRIASDYKELTLKKKLNNENSVVRIERNMQMHMTMTKEKIDGYLKELGYEYNTTIYKSCHVYEFDYYTLVYYICMNENMEEIGRFIEIEMKEEYPWQDVDHALSELNALEIICKPLGLRKKDRINESLFELFRVPAIIKKELQ